MKATEQVKCRGITVAKWEGKRVKTLDEVIKALELCSSENKCLYNCPYSCKEGIECIDEMEKDALHYLKHLQEYYNISREHHEPNEPLTWDELQQMEGKPVWVHLFGSGLGEWNLIHAQLDNLIWFADGNGYIYDMNAEKLGKTWQAYRKERE